MSRLTVLLIGIALAIAMIGLLNCDDDHHDPMDGNNNTQSPQIVSVYPQDSATGVSTAASISLKFDSPMDTTSVMANFHLAGSSPMHDWMDTLDHYHGMGGMGMMDMDHMMEWMDSIHYSGHFQWNGAMDSCQFIMDPPLMPNTDHMMFMYGDIKGHNGMIIDMHDLEYDGYMYHFRTGP